jgi:hypothetical protein
VQFRGAVDAAQLESVFAFASEDGQFIISPRHNWTATCNRRCPLGMPPNNRQPVKSGSNGAYGSHRQPAASKQD